MVALYLISFAIIFCLLLWRMIVGGTSALLCYLFINCNLTLGTLVYFLVLWAITERECEVELLGGGVGLFFFWTGILIALCFGPALLFVVLNANQDIWPRNEWRFADKDDESWFFKAIIGLHFIAHLGLSIVLPIVYDEQKDAGFWVGLMLITYLEIF